MFEFLTETHGRLVQLLKEVSRPNNDSDAETSEKLLQDAAQKFSALIVFNTLEALKERNIGEDFLKRLWDNSQRTTDLIAFSLPKALLLKTLEAKKLEDTAQPVGIKRKNEASCLTFQKS